MISDPNLLVGNETRDDAGVYRIGDYQALVFTVDFFPPIVDDPFSYGAIAVANSLSDIYAMGARPLLGLNIVGFPIDQPKEILGEILQGGYAKAAEAGCLIVGGHTVDDAEPKYGLAAVGLVEPGKQVTNAGARPGDRLVLTKPLGTGIITTAGKRGEVEAEVLERAVSHHEHTEPGRLGSHDQSRRECSHGHHRLRAGGPPGLHDAGQRRPRRHPAIPGPGDTRHLGAGGSWLRTGGHPPQPEERGPQRTVARRHARGGPSYSSATPRPRAGC